MATDNNSSTLVPIKPTSVRWTVFALAMNTSALLYLHRYIFAYIKPTLQEEWQLTNSELGSIDSAFSLCYSLFQFPLGIAADAAGVYLVLTVLTLVWCGGLGMMAWAPSAKVMWLAQATLGTGQSAVYACLNRISRMWYPPQIRTTLQGAVGVLAGRLGALSASVVFTTILLGMLGLYWRTAIWILVAVGLVHLISFVVLFRNSPREHLKVNLQEVLLIEGTSSHQATDAPKPTPRMSVVQMFDAMTPRSIVNLLFLAVQSILSTFADNIYSNWIPLFLKQVHDLEFKQMGIFSALPLLGGAIGGLLGGYLNDYWITKTGNVRWSRIGVAFVGKGMAAILLFAGLLFYDRPYAFCGCLFFVKLFGDWSLATSLGVVTDIGGRATASVYALNNSLAGLGFIAAPLVFGHLSQHYSWRAVFIAVAITYVLCAISWFFINSTIPILAEDKTKS